MSESATAVAGSEVVVCYCDADESFCNALSTGLDSLREERVISSWRRRRVSMDSAESLPASDSFQVALVLLSPEFLATGFLEQEEFASQMAARTPACSDVDRNSSSPISGRSAWLSAWACTGSPQSI